MLSHTKGCHCADAIWGFKPTTMQPQTHCGDPPRLAPPPPGRRNSWDAFKRRLTLTHHRPTCLYLLSPYYTAFGGSW